MPLLSPSVLSRPGVMQAVVLARRVFAAWYVRSAADIIRERASLAVVKELEQEASCWTPIDVSAELKGVAGSDSHFGYRTISTVLPLAYGWAGDLTGARQLVAAKAPADRLPCAEIHTPVLALVDYISECTNGHPGLIHGGMTAIIAHSSMSLVSALNMTKGTQAEVVSRSLNMDYRKPIRTGQFVKIFAWLYGHEHGQLKAAVHFYSPDGQMLVEAISDLEVVEPSAGTVSN
ncbi:hypothetical protein IWW38_002085 [Coemansia aciculifera]|uniref:Uncharacterized protein n=1 Tax=Coemansia aciculifera TaxID=417176 RepID=A0ACC1M673_9FUNG|nr:hypothetical protein IWW38_002085 [Coemansia aciculifera]